MNSFIPSPCRNVVLGLLVALALFGSAPAARAAAPRPAPVLAVAAPVFADDEVSFTRWLKGFLNRGRIVQICIVFMLLALFIIIKKFSVDRPL